MYLPEPPIFSKISGGNVTVPVSSIINSLSLLKSSTSTSTCVLQQIYYPVVLVIYRRMMLLLLSELRLEMRLHLLCSFLNSASTSRLVMGSKAPVGSSARINLGLVIKARAIATRCCSPPLSFIGRALARCKIPNLSSISSANLRAFLDDTLMS